MKGKRDAAMPLIDVDVVRLLPTSYNKFDKLAFIVVVIVLSRLDLVKRFAAGARYAVLL